MKKTFTLLTLLIIISIAILMSCEPPEIGAGRQIDILNYREHEISEITMSSNVFGTIDLVDRNGSAVTVPAADAEGNPGLAVAPAPEYLPWGPTTYTFLYTDNHTEKVEVNGPQYGNDIEVAKPPVPVYESHLEITNNTTQPITSVILSGDDSYQNPGEDYGSGDKIYLQVFGLPADGILPDESYTITLRSEDESDVEFTAYVYVELDEGAEWLGPKEVTLTIDGTDTVTFP